jgi:uncharacterized protein YjbJ (UPF0337 family)
MNRDRIDGIGHQLIGGLKQGIGKMIGDAKLTTDGAEERSSGKAQNDLGSIKDAAEENAALGKAAEKYSDPAA